MLGVGGAGVMYLGAREILAGRMTVGSFFTYTMFLGFLVGPFFQIATIGSQLTEALAGLERTRDILRERPEDEDPRRATAPRRDARATWSSRTWASPTPRRARRSFAASRSRAGRAR